MSEIENNLNDEYCDRVAEHYFSYRPNLHELILERGLKPNESFTVGLDIGCGTGYSTYALAKYCKKVYGVDSSASMLGKATSNKSVIFKNSSGDNLSGFEADEIDIVTMAGSLFYIKNTRLRKELNRACKAESIIFIYDFETVFDEHVKALGISPKVIESSYDHKINLSDWDEFPVVEKIEYKELLELTSEQYAHLLLSNNFRYSQLSKFFKNNDPFTDLIQYLDSKSVNYKLEVEIFYTLHRRK